MKDNLLEQQIKDFTNGIIVICPKCSKVDIHPINHNCDPEMEYQRQMAQEYYD